MNPFKKHEKQVSIFVTAGYPERDSLVQLLPELEKEGIDFIEVGIPFSDPMADGPVIQATSMEALQNGMSIAVLFEQLTAVRSSVSLPLVMMGYLNPVLQFGLEKFLEKCAELHIASTILPDMSLELYERFYKTSFEKYGIGVTFLVTPNTPDERIERIAATCANSFVYLVGQSSITGKGYSIGEDQQKRFAEIKKLCGETPLFMGFGIDSRAKKEQAFEQCDGAIVGTAYLKALKAGVQDQFLDHLLGKEIVG